MFYKLSVGLMLCVLVVVTMETHYGLAIVL